MGKLSHDDVVRFFSFFFFFCTNLDNPVLISFNIVTKAAVSHSFLTLISAI